MASIFVNNSEHHWGHGDHGAAVLQRACWHRRTDEPQELVVLSSMRVKDAWVLGTWYLGSDAPSS